MNRLPLELVAILIGNIIEPITDQWFSFHANERSEYKSYEAKTNALVRQLDALNDTSATFSRALQLNSNLWLLYQRLKFLRQRPDCETLFKKSLFVDPRIVRNAEGYARFATDINYKVSELFDFIMMPQEIAFKKVEFCAMCLERALDHLSEQLEILVAKESCHSHKSFVQELYLRPCGREEHPWQYQFHNYWDADDDLKQSVRRLGTVFKQITAGHGRIVRPIICEKCDNVEFKHLECLCERQYCRDSDCYECDHLRAYESDSDYEEETV